MMDKRISVDLTGPAKIEGKYRRQGETVAVTLDTARELDAAGVIAPIDWGVSVSELASGAPGFDAAVQDAAKLLAEDAIAAAVNVATAPLIEEVAGLRAENEALQRALAEATATVPANATTSEAKPAEQEAEKPAPKKQAPAKG